jgi:L-ascorbate metabolism protein UlaG (beta-lactamase superfamily)
MTIRSALAVTTIALAAGGCGSPKMDHRPPPDVVARRGGDITVAPITHATVEISQGSHVILVDPTQYAAYDGVGRLALNYDGLPPPMLILITDIHVDHEDHTLIAQLKTPAMTVLGPPAVAREVPGVTAIANGQSGTYDGVKVDAVAMYNPGAGSLHPRGRGNGYIVTLGGTRIYFAGDTGCTPEMRALSDIDVAFLPMNLPYTMAPAKAAECAAAFKPRMVYPYHYRGQDPRVFESALRGTGIEVRLRDWYVGAKQ